MKKKFLCLMTASILALSPAAAYADEKDDRIAELEAQVTELQAQVADLEAQLEAAAASSAPADQESYKIGETWTVADLFKVTVDSVEETPERNEFSDKNPAAVYVVTYTYENLGLTEDMFVMMDDSIIDCDGKMGYSYPGDITLYPQEVPAGARCEAQACIGVDNPGDFKIRVILYDDEYNEYKAMFSVELS